MKLKLIIQENHPELLVFFAGWGTDETPFLHLKSKSTDVAVLYDYTLDPITGLEPETESVFLQSLTGRYKAVRLAAWSMGVWSAEYFFSRRCPSFKPVRAVAVNGTLYPIHSSLGIPPAVYDGTMKNLPEGLSKFHLRMCGQKEIYEKYKRCIPGRSPGDLQTELQALRERISAFPVELPEEHIRWDTALISENDRIFPAQNQQVFWHNYFLLQDSYGTGRSRTLPPQAETWSDRPGTPEITPARKTGTGPENPVTKRSSSGTVKNGTAVILIPGGHFPFFRWTYWEDLFAAGTSPEIFPETSAGTSVVPSVK